MEKYLFVVVEEVCEVLELGLERVDLLSGFFTFDAQSLLFADL